MTRFDGSVTMVVRW